MTMVYLEFEPNDILSPFIDCFWTAQGKTEATQSYKILPDGYSDFIFCLGSTEPPGCGSPAFHPYRSFYAGAMTTFSELASAPSGRADMLGVRFKPGGLAAFSDFPLYEFKNKRVNITETKFPFDPDFAERLCELESTEKRIEEIENLLFSRLKTSHYPVEPAIAYAIKSITASQGRISIKRLMNDICLCQRHFERKFRIKTGYSPKELCRIARFRNTAAVIQTACPENFEQLAVDCGYYDHSHLLKEFHLLAGVTPADFRSFPEKGPVPTQK